MVRPATVPAAARPGVSRPSRTSRLSSWVWCTTSSSTPSCGYSFFSVFRQWAQAVTILVALASFRVSAFSMASCWKTNSLPARRAGSPVQVSPLPSTAYETPGRVQQLGDRLGGLLGPVVVRAGAADPEQVVHLGQVLDVLADHGHVEGQVLGPVHPAARAHRPRISLVLQAFEQAVELGRELRLHHHLVPAQIEDVVDVLDVDRALLHAGAAGGAGPQHVGVDHPGHPVARPGSGRPAAGWPRRGPARGRPSRAASAACR